MRLMLHIYHTNDLHSHFEHWPRIHEFLTKRKLWHTEEGDEFLLLDIGDHIDRYHPYSEGTKGKGNIDLLNTAQYDAITIGNNEGITFPHEDLDGLYQHANFPVLVANLYKQDGTRPDWVKPFSIIETKSGTRIGLIGLTVYFEHLYHLLGWKLTDPLKELKSQLKQLSGQVNVIILLSHLGINEDEKIAAEFPEIDLILGAHTHHLFHEGKVINNSLLAAAGKYGQFIGHVSLEMGEHHKIMKKSARLYDTNELPPIDGEEGMIDSYQVKGKVLLGDQVVVLPEAIPSHPLKESPLAQLLCTALHEWCEADCAFLNAGLLLEGLGKGKITHYDLLSICPHPINPCVIELSGTELREVLRQTLDGKWPHLQIKGLGFRGTVMGVFHYSGIVINHHNQGTEFFVGDESIQSEKTYKLAIPDMFTFGRFFPEIYRAENKNYFLPEFMRDLLAWKIKQVY
jgi:5'-nucleotidase